MNRVDWVIVRRLLGNIGLTLLIMYGLVLLVESLSTSRFSALMRLGGPGVALLAIAASAARWLLDTLPLTVLVGAVAGLLNLQTTREMTVIKASGASVWRLMRAPLATAILGGLAISMGLHALVVTIDRGLTPQGGEAQVSTGAFWLDERNGPLHYIIEAGYVHPSGEALGNITIFMLDPPRDRIEAETARLMDGEWVMPTATRFVTARVPEAVTDLHVPTTISRGDMQAKLSSVKDMTVYELAATLAAGLNDARQRAETLTQFVKLIGLPAALCGSLVIAFAFTAGYRRTNKYGGAVLYGIVLGFVVYVVTEMAGRAGDAGVIQPVVAVFGPALVAIVAGATVLLNREDGRT
jgi:lipopolysaccharide export system permease protein